MSSYESYFSHFRAMPGFTPSTHLFWKGVLDIEICFKELENRWSDIFCVTDLIESRFS